MWKRMSIAPPAHDVSEVMAPASRRVLSTLHHHNHILLLVGVYYGRYMRCLLVDDHMITQRLHLYCITPGVAREFKKKTRRR